LQQTTQLILILNARLWMDNPTLICDGTITAHEDIIGDGLAENLDLEHVGDYLFGFPIEIWMHESDVVVAGDNIPERGEALFYPLYGDRVREGVAEMLQFLIGGRGWHKQSVTIPWVFQMLV